MARHSSMIPMNGEVFKDIVWEKAKRSLSSLEECLGVSRQAINGWVSKNRIPPKKLSALVKELGLSIEDIKAITHFKKEESFILFRSNRNVSISDDTQVRLLSVADDYFRLNQFFELEGKSTEIILPQRDPKETAELIVKNLELNRYNLDLKQVITALNRFNISVLFYDFEDKKAQAVCIKKGGKKVIFINSNEQIEDVCWRIFHEVCHIFCGHTNPSKSDEEFCNKVATEIVTPLDFFTHNLSYFKEKFKGAPNTEQMMIIDDVMRRFSAGFFGVVLRLRDVGAISKFTFGKYSKIWAQRRKIENEKVNSIYLPKNEVSTLDHWNKILTDSDKDSYLHFQVLILKAIVLNKISYDRASELMGYLDIKTTQEIAEMWKRKIEDEVNY